jgi:type IV pilus assembly protein PilE
MRERRTGMTLLELLIAVALVGMFAAVAIPSYTVYTETENRADATKTMTLDAQALERCHSRTFTYLGCATAPAGTATSPQGFYSVTIAPAAKSYTITAVPIKKPQTRDSSCAQLTLNSAGIRGATNSGGALNTQACWGSG